MYSANYYIAQYLIGKGLTPTSSNYRYYYFEESEALTTALAEMPNFYFISFANLWG